MTQNGQNKDLKSLKNSDSINALQLIGKPLNAEDIVKAEEMIRMNYGIDYPKEKFAMLWEVIQEEGWTDYRLRETVKWFLKTKKFPNWTIADFFEFGVKLYSHNEYIRQLNENKNLNEEIEWYYVPTGDGEKIMMWKYKDGVELPLEKVNIRRNNETPKYCYNCDKDIKVGIYCSKACKEEFEAFMRQNNLTQVEHKK